MKTQKIKISELRQMIRESLKEERSKKSLNESKTKKVNSKEFKNIVRCLIKEELDNEKTFSIYELSLGQPSRFWSEEKKDFVSDKNKATLYTKEDAIKKYKELDKIRRDKYAKDHKNYKELHVGDLFDKGILK